METAVANLAKSAFFCLFPFNFLSNRPAQNDPQTGGQCGKRHANVASLIINTANDHSTHKTPTDPRKKGLCSTTQGEHKVSVDDIHHDVLRNKCYV